MKSIRFVIFLTTLLFLCGCDHAKTGWNESALSGTWKFTSVEGATKEKADRFLYATRETSTALVLSSDNTYKFTFLDDVFRGNWKWEGGNVILTQTEKNSKPESDSVTLQVIGEELIAKDKEMSLVLSRAK